MAAWDLSVRLDEDFFYDFKDRYRTGGLLITYKINKDVTLAFGASMLTGEVGTNEYGTKMLYFDSEKGPNNTVDPTFEKGKMRGGTMYGGVIYKNQAYFAGTNSEKRLHKVQNAIHNNKVPVLNWFQNLTSPYFEDMNYKSKYYGYYGTYNKNYLYY